MDVLKAALSNREYEIISECALSNFSETPHPVPTLDDPRYGTSTTPSHVSASSSESIHDLSKDAETWITNKFSVSINLVELSLHSGSTRDSPLASVQVLNFCAEKCFQTPLTALFIFQRFSFPLHMGFLHNRNYDHVASLSEHNFVRYHIVTT